MQQSLLCLSYIIGLKVSLNSKWSYACVVLNNVYCILCSFKGYLSTSITSDWISFTRDMRPRQMSVFYTFIWQLRLRIPFVFMTSFFTHDSVIFRKTVVSFTIINLGGQRIHYCEAITWTVCKMDSDVLREDLHWVLTLPSGQEPCVSTLTNLCIWLEIRIWLITLMITQAQRIELDYKELIFHIHLDKIF